MDLCKDGITESRSGKITPGAKMARLMAACSLSPWAGRMFFDANERFVFTFVQIDGVQSTVIIFAAVASQGSYF